MRAQTVLKYGLPQRSMPALQAYAAAAMPSTDFQYMLMALMLLASRPMALVLPRLGTLLSAQLRDSQLITSACTVVAPVLLLWGPKPCLS